MRARRVSVNIHLPKFHETVRIYEIFSGQGDWTGSTVEVDCHDGSVTVYYVDEIDEIQEKRKNTRGFLERLLRID